MQQQDTGKFRKQTADKFYTKPIIATQCIGTILSMLPRLESYQWIEPSVGGGAFLRALPPQIDTVCIDIEPAPGLPGTILKGDFLLWKPTLTKPCIVFGNPPFGRQGSAAKAFIKHASTFADIIAFILPRSFTKPSMSRSFPREFHCIYTCEIDDNAFEVNDKPYDVPCIFQIWEKRATLRDLPSKVDAHGYTYIKDDSHRDIAFRRVGVYAGRAFDATTGIHSVESHYFLALDPQYRPHIHVIIDKINAHIFPSNTVGPRSLSKSEANIVINQILLEL
jgi:hypothetical protein